MILKKTKLILIGGEQWVDIRTDEVERIKQKRTTTRIIVNDEFMDLPYSKVRFGKKFTEETFSTKYPPFGEYQLISFRWKPSGKLTTLQLSLVN